MGCQCTCTDRKRNAVCFASILRVLKPQAQSRESCTRMLTRLGTITKTHTSFSTLQNRVVVATGPGQSARTAQHQSTSMSESDAEGFFSSGMRHQRALGDKKFAYKTVITHGKWKASPAMLRASVSDNMWNGATDGSVGKPWRER